MRAEGGGMNKTVVESAERSDSSLRPPPSSLPK
jgi:hypothetical protein